MRGRYHFDTSMVKAVQLLPENKPIDNLQGTDIQKLVTRGALNLRGKKSSPLVQSFMELNIVKRHGAGKWHYVLVMTSVGGFKVNNSQCQKERNTQFERLLVWKIYLRSALLMASQALIHCFNTE
ncbi:hypothetical protein KIL84_000067 [Mauremys mutica]|uniref:Uncharacterized protein n=1 Tax=Mauremys mutica TaxID=74926 RepID=A0A9D3XFJ6_9SAUR|nr:hypothetical protein KIL84_000067 [Mauremys mutica]